MKLIRCHIENFGKLSDFTYEFTEGCNTICEENGWGKSTLAAFLRVMLFGFRNEGKRDPIENERKRYTPWQKGIYGGELQFESDGKTYSVRRTFGSKAAEDEFQLTDPVTHLPSEDFTEKLGEELFQIDAGSFERTTFISQNDCETFVTDSINAKIGNLAENTDDINNFETADKRLNDLLNAMSPTRKTGSIRRDKDRITELKTQIRNGQDLKGTMDSIRARKEEVIAEREKLAGELEELQARQKELGAYKDQQAKKEKYLDLRAQLAERERLLKEAKSYFNGVIPTEEDLRKCLSQCNDAESIRRAMELSTQFGSEPPRGVQYEEQEVEYREKLARLKTLETIQQQEQRRILREQETGRKRRSVFGILGIVLLLAGVICLLLRQSIAGGILLALGIVALGAAWFISSGIPGEETLENGEILDLRAELERLEEEQRRTAKVQRQRQEERERRYQEQKARYEDLEQRIHSFFTHIGILMEEHPEEQLAELLNRRRDYRNALQEYQNREQELKAFEKVTDVPRLLALKAPEGEESLENLTEEMKAVSAQMEERFCTIGSYQEQLSNLQESWDNVESMQDELENLQGETEEKLKQYELLGMTKKLLEDARSSFTARYTEPVMEGFRKYYKILTGTECENYQMDANTKLQVIEGNMPREIGYMSLGNRDLIGICMRMALVEAMYETRQPFLILDDPFVNLDENRTKGAMQFLAEIAKEYQVIYFTCHGSRYER